MNATTLTAPDQLVAAEGTPQRARSYRLDGIDLMRGLVIVLMAIDHVRDYVYADAMLDPMTDPNASYALYFTRWITHFCAPVFVLLAGTSAALMASRRTPRELAMLLFTRGLWLIAVEWFVVATAFTFAPHGIAELDGRVLVVMQVIWAIGASMIVLAGAQFLGRGACLAIGAAIVLGHNLLDGWWPAEAEFAGEAPLWVALHAQTTVTAGPFHVLFLYPLLPWTGVMLLGYGIAGLFERAPAQRDAWLRRAGLAMILAFLWLRVFSGYGDPNPWRAQDAGGLATLLDFLNVTKYPPSLLYLLATLGPAALACAFADRVRGTVREVLLTFGRVPFAFYIAHWVLIHALSVALGVLQGFDPSQFLTAFLYFPDGYGLSLPGVYGVWALVIALLYPFCRWMEDVKARRRDWWLSYV